MELDQLIFVIVAIVLTSLVVPFVIHWLQTRGKNSFLPPPSDNNHKELS